MHMNVVPPSRGAQLYITICIVTTPTRSKQYILTVKKTEIMFQFLIFLEAVIIDEIEEKKDTSVCSLSEVYFPTSLFTEIIGYNMIFQVENQLFMDENSA